MTGFPDHPPAFVEIETRHHCFCSQEKIRETAIWRSKRHVDVFADLHGACPETTAMTVPALVRHHACARSGTAPRMVSHRVPDEEIEEAQRIGAGSAEGGHLRRMMKVVVRPAVRCREFDPVAAVRLES
jgi:hypothetical protein